MQAQNYSIKTWPPDDRPREKLLRIQARNCTDSELLAILIGTGIKEKNALELARELLQGVRFNLPELARMDSAELLKIKGIGSARASVILAALELGRRRQVSGVLDKPVIRDSSEVAGYMRIMLQDLHREVFVVLFLNQANRVNHYETISEGGITGTVADPRIIMKKALESQAVNLILCHNHPSGNLRPSKADEDLTFKIREAARLFDIRVMDHIIVSHEGYFSFADSGLI